MERQWAEALQLDRTSLLTVSWVKQIYNCIVPIVQRVGGVLYLGRNDFPYALTKQFGSFLGHWPETGLLPVIYLLRVDSKY